MAKVSAVTVAIDLSLWGCSVVMIDEGGASWFRCETNNLGGSAQLSSFIEEGLEKLKRRSEQVQRVLVATGPGSYTGIRVGIAWAYGFCQPEAGRQHGSFSAVKEAALQLSSSGQLSKLAVVVPMSRFSAIVGRVVNNHCECAVLPVLGESFAEAVLGYTGAQLQVVAPLRPMAVDFSELSSRGTVVSRAQLFSAAASGIAKRLQANDPNLAFSRSSLDACYLAEEWL